MKVKINIKKPNNPNYQCGMNRACMLPFLLANCKDLKKEEMNSEFALLNKNIAKKECD